MLGAVVYYVSPISLVKIATWQAWDVGKWMAKDSFDPLTSAFILQTYHVSLKDVLLISYSDFDSDSNMQYGHVILIKAVRKIIC